VTVVSLRNRCPICELYIVSVVSLVTVNQHNPLSFQLAITVKYWRPVTIHYLIAHGFHLFDSTAT
jgi:hypothetical protein